MILPKPDIIDKKQFQSQVLPVKTDMPPLANNLAATLNFVNVEGVSDTEYSDEDTGEKDGEDL
jgi:hypothetical protein